VAEEIQNGIAAGKEVTVHEKAINAYGFSGFGYIIIDPETGVGGYLIEGKGSGSWAMGAIIGASIGYLVYGMFTPTFTASLQPQLIADLVEMLSIILLGVIILLSIFSIFDTLQDKNQISIKCFLSGFVTTFINFSLSIGTVHLCRAKPELCSIIVSTVIGMIATYTGFLPEYLTPLSPKDCHVN